MKKKSLLVGITIIGFLGSFLIASSAKQSNLSSDRNIKILGTVTPTPTQAPAQTDKEIDDAATPVVNLNSLINTNVDEKRRKKNRRFNNRGVVVADIAPNVGGAEITPETDIPDLPFALSDLVIEGDITDSNALLSEDKTGIYSEFTVLVTEIVKSSPSAQVKKNDSITAERFGGRVRYPSGQIVRYRVAGRGSPKKGGKYFLFLKKIEDSDSYRIVTGYEIHNNKVFALDGSRVSFKGIGNQIFDKHNGKDLQEFKREINKILTEENQ